ncbi:hypothetical protein [Pseudomonas sp. BN411]|uniref:hypothetical protein n=1 Tax=Pseudomonas sp. BN411 TaxID=2567887 RepID=UPI0024585986|nr:hypothetical protein [Pseudomonas sp. BN411]MDH4560059.1 hypothetical protein [Pseudomonas sp. BN411]
MLLAALLASASLQLQPQAPGQASVSLCFEPAGAAIRYELLVTTQSPAGRSQSRQKGVAERNCPVHNSLRLPPGTRVEARLRWWVEGVEQVAVVREVGL